ncbi:speckle-type POZ protein-like [Planococcus citri]|uniref:speckle-type POZ protein-like n=1 Tax=Planococcus citri TaxID=170843 RepID=UPI0031F7E8DF
MSKRECIHMWRIDCYSTVAQCGTQTSSKFSATDDDLYWRLEHTVHKFADHVFVSLNLRPDCNDDLRKFESVSGHVDIILMTSTGGLQGKYGGKRSSFTLCFDEQKCNYNKAEFSMDNIREFLNGNSLVILCKLTYHKINETVPISPPKILNTIKTSESRLSSDMGRCFAEDHFKDVTISVKGKEYRAHKTILATRSTVFDKMLRVDMLESKKNHIEITDVDHEPFEEMLYYMYTGKVKNLNKLAFELLPLADKYDLEELKSMCENALLWKLTTDNAARMLILADTHRVGELKRYALRFIRENYESCEDFKDTEFWKNLAASNAELLKEMMAAFCKKQKLT